MKSFTIGFLIIVSLISCKKERLEKPENLLSKIEMRDILIEEGLSNNFPHNLLDTAVRKITHKPDLRMLKILELKKTTLENFKLSHRYYSMYPSEYQVIFKMIKDSLDKDLTKLKIEDSIAKLDKKVEEPKKKSPTVLSKKELEKIDRRKKDSIMKPINRKKDSLRKVNKAKKPISVS